MKTAEDKQIRNALLVCGVGATIFGVAYGMVFKSFTFYESWKDVWGFYGEIILSVVLLSLAIGAGLVLKGLYSSYINHR